MVRVKDDTAEPVKMRALAEDIARCYLEVMRVRLPLSVPSSIRFRRLTNRRDSNAAVT